MLKFLNTFLAMFSSENKFYFISRKKKQCNVEEHDNSEKVLTLPSNFLKFDNAPTLDEWRKFLEHVGYGDKESKEQGHLYFLNNGRPTYEPLYGRRPYSFWFKIALTDDISDTDDLQLQRIKELCTDRLCLSPKHRKFVPIKEKERKNKEYKIAGKTKDVKTVASNNKTVKTLKNNDQNYQVAKEYQEVHKNPQENRLLCPSRKITYINENVARYAVSRVREKKHGKVAAKKIRSYVCPYCGFYHITTHYNSSIKRTKRVY